MNLSAIIKAVMAPAKMTPDEDLLSGLKPGDRLTAQVVKILKDGQALLDLGRTRVLAQISFNVRPGQSLRLQVIDNGPVLRFRAQIPQQSNRSTPAPAPITEFIKVLTPHQQAQLANLAQQLKANEDSRIFQKIIPSSVRNAVFQIGSLFEPIPMERPTEQIAEWIKNAVQQKGSLFEKSLADFLLKTGQASGEAKTAENQTQLHNGLIMKDIKPQLMVFQRFLSEDSEKLIDLLSLDSKQLEQVRQSVDRLLAHLVEQQEKSIARWQSGETQQVMVHLFGMKDQTPPVALKVYYPEKKRKKGWPNHPYHIALLLDMDQLGPVRADLTLCSQQLHIRFFVGSEAVQILFQQHLEDIRDSLKFSIKQLQMDVFLSPEKIQRFYQEDATGAAAGRIDLTI